MQTIEEYPMQNIAISEVKRDPDNPNVMSDAQMDALREIMKKYGFLGPLVLDSKQIIVDGEHRLAIYEEFERETGSFRS